MGLDRTILYNFAQTEEYQTMAQYASNKISALLHHQPYSYRYISSHTGMPRGCISVLRHQKRFPSTKEAHILAIFFEIPIDMIFPYGSYEQVQEIVRKREVDKIHRWMNLSSRSIHSMSKATGYTFKTVQKAYHNQLFPRVGLADRIAKVVQQDWEDAKQNKEELEHGDKIIQYELQ